jgi:predicted branched-subunit amino acid permease
VRRVRRRHRPAQDDAVQFLVPTNVSGWSIVACYAGFIGMCLPLFGLVFAIPAVICGIEAQRRRKKTASYGSVTSDIRAILGLVFSSIAILLWGGLAALILWNVVLRR